MLQRSGYEVPSLSALSKLLRDQEAWPETFNWYWPDTCSCAIGLAMQKWKFLRSHDELAQALGLRSCEMACLFGHTNSYRLKPGEHAENLRPETVANAIDRFLNNG
jgi:hypothetical protein